MDDVLVLATLALQWAERLQKLNKLIIDSRNGVKIDFAALQAEDDAARDAFQQLIEAKKAAGG